MTLDLLTRNYSFLIIFVLLVSIFTSLYIDKIRQTNFNWFKIPELPELYFVNYEKKAGENLDFTLYSSKDTTSQFVFCNQNESRPLKKGLNEISLDISTCKINSSQVLNISTGENYLILNFERVSSQDEVHMIRNPSETPKVGQYQIENVFLIVSVLAISFLLKKKLRLDIISFSLVVFSFLVIFLTFQFQLFRNFGLSSWLVPLFSILGFLILYKLKFEPKTISLVIKKEILIFAFFYTLIVFVLKFFVGNFDVWWPYYLRNVEKTYSLQSTLYLDDLSYLGRPFTYPPVFFQFASQIASIFKTNSFSDIQFWFHISLVFLFSITSYMLFSSFKERKQRIVSVLIFVTLTFTFLTTVAGTLHTFSFILLNLSVIYFNQKNETKFLSPVLLALAFATHPLALFLFPVYVFSTNSFKLNNLKEIATYVLISVLISLVFYLPILSQNGLPYEIVPRQWGYLITFGVPGMYFDFQLLIPLILISLIFGLINKKFLLPSFTLLTLVFSYIYISYRLNMFIVAILASLFVLLFEKQLKNGYVFILVVGILLSNFFFASLQYSGTTDWCTWGAVNQICINPLSYVERFTNTDESVAINPLFGHLETLIGKRKVLSDLYVEYADEEKFNAAVQFYQNSDISLLEKYNITIFVLDDIGRERYLNSSFDRLYDNTFFHVFRKC
jgi:hypothetical protein